MENEQIITLHFLRFDGKRERIKVAHNDLAEARKLAELVFRKGDGLYIEVDICLENGHVETIQNLQAMRAH